MSKGFIGTYKDCPESLNKDKRECEKGCFIKGDCKDNNYKMIEKFKKESVFKSRVFKIFRLKV
jgi:hypothetical protein